MLMRRNRSIPLRAFFLLVVFLLNTVVGFACVVGLEDGHGHTNEYVSGTHHHEHDNNIADDHHHSNSDHDHKGLNDHHDTKKNRDNCCKEEVTKLLKEDKVSPSKTAVNIQPVSFIALVPSFHQFDAFASSGYVPNTKYFVRSYHPPIADIRISIQSFQI
jgi:hypothetical protein